MGITLKDIIGLTKEIPEECFEETYEKLREIKEKSDREQELKSELCLRCGSDKVVRNGKRNGRQAYRCKACGKTFTETATSSIAHSHSSKTVWKQVIQDTIDGVRMV